MILVYDPYAPPHNITALPWTNAHLQHAYFHHQLAPPPAPALHIQVRLATSTGLEVNSSVIVENHAPLLIAEAETVGKEMSSIRRILVKRKRTADRLYKKEEKEGREGKERQIYDVKLRITNPYPETLKYRVLLISEPKMRELSKLQDLLGRYK